MRVLVTGAGGLIGQAVVPALVACGHRITTLQRGPLRRELGQVQQLRTDVRSPEARQAAASAEAVVHLGGSGDVAESWRAPNEYLQVIAGGTLNLLRGVVVSRGPLIFPSTQRVYQPTSRPLRESDPVAPADPYALAKWTAESYCALLAKRYELSARVLRFFSVYGPGQKGQGNSGVLAIFLQRARAGDDITVDPGPRRDFTHVDDAALGICLALERAAGDYRVYNVATGQGTSLEALAQRVVALTGSGSRIVKAPGTWRDGDLVADISLARQELGYQPRIGLEEGLRSLVEDLRPRNG
jgi:UDP-glucose 4-epimerase